MKNKRMKVILIILLAVISLGAGVSIALFKNVKSVDSQSPEGAVNAKQYYRENSNVKEVMVNSPDKLETIQTEAEVLETMRTLGFENIEMTAEYDMNGGYFGNVITSESSEFHPLYQGEYITPEGESWIIYSINGCIMAYPVTYNMQEDVEVVAALSETKELMSYDSVTNTFFRTIPKEDTVNVIIVDHLNRETVDLYTVEKLGEG